MPQAWVITSDRKIDEYKENITSKGVLFHRIAIAVLGLLSLIFVSIWQATSPQSLARLSKLSHKYAYQEKKLSNSEEKSTSKQQTYEVWKAVTGQSNTPESQKLAIDTEDPQTVEPDQSIDQRTKLKAASNIREPKELISIEIKLRHLGEDFYDLNTEKTSENRQTILKELRSRVREQVGTSSI